MRLNGTEWDVGRGDVGEIERALPCSARLWPLWTPFFRRHPCSFWTFNSVIVSLHHPQLSIRRHHPQTPISIPPPPYHLPKLPTPIRLYAYPSGIRARTTLLPRQTQKQTNRALRDCSTSRRRVSTQSPWPSRSVHTPRPGLPTLRPQVARLPYL